MNKCLQCNSQIKPKNKFCNNSCAAKYNNKGRQRTEESKRKVSDSIKKYQKENPQALEEFKNYGKLANINKKKSIIKSKCIICETKIEYPKYKPVKYCSKECRNKGRSKSAIKQLKKGNGKKGYYKGIWCDSRYELVFVIYNVENEIPIKRCEELFTYCYNDKKHKYNPDFTVNGIIYEIKGYYNERAQIKHNSANKIKEVKLLKKEDLKPYYEYVEKKFKVSKNKLHTLYDR